MQKAKSPCYTTYYKYLEHFVRRAEMKIYLDMCCYNRPYDDQSQIKIALETQSKLYIQHLIKDKKLELITSAAL